MMVQFNYAYVSHQAWKTIDNEMQELRCNIPNTTLCVLSLSNWFRAAQIYAVSWIGYIDGIVQDCSNSSALSVLHLAIDI